MGSKNSKTPAPPPAELQMPWRTVTWGETDDMFQDLADFKASTGVLKILVCGPIGAGKSCFINSSQRILLGRNFISALEHTAQRGKSFTCTKKTHKLKRPEGDYFPFEFVDTMGLEPENLEGIHPEDITAMLKGHILDGYQFNPLAAINEENNKYKKNPSLSDRVHCVVSILPADSVSMTDNKIFKKFDKVRIEASKLEIPQVVVLTKVDKVCEMVNQDLQKIFHSIMIKQKVDICSTHLGISLNSLYPVKNYYAEVTQDASTDLLILKALTDIVHFANDYAEDQKRSGVK